MVCLSTAGFSAQTTRCAVQPWKQKSSEQLCSPFTHFSSFFFFLQTTNLVRFWLLPSPPLRSYMLQLKCSGLQKVLQRSHMLLGPKHTAYIRDDSPSTNQRTHESQHPCQSLCQNSRQHKHKPVRH